MRKRTKITAFLLAAAVFTTDFGGYSVSAMQAGAGDISGQSGDNFMAPGTSVSGDDGTDQRTEAENGFAALLQEYDMYGMTANGTSIPVYKNPSVEALVVRNLSSGYQVRFLGAVIQADGIWFQAAFAVQGVEYTGFLREDSVISQDTRLEAWKNQYFTGRMGRAAVTSDTAGQTDLSAFPSSYRSYIKTLINAHPNWTFVPMNTGLDWAEVVKNEMVNARNLVYVTEPILWKSTAEEDYNMSTGQWIAKDGQNWVQASESIVKHYLDPRNFLNEESVFQFEQLTYNSAYHNESGVEKILSGTFMSKKKLEDGSGGGITYAKAFMKIGKELKVSPYFLASRIRQEQGVKGDSPLISGKYPGYKGYYNYFNISAFGLGEQVVINGLKEAKAAGWTTRYAALLGGAKKTAEKYITKGQDTFYLQKFDVDDSYDGLYWHQYMQNLLAADNEGKNVRRSYESMGAINNKFVFKVPVYKNMPSSAYPKPGEKLEKTKLTVKKSGTVAKLSWNEVSGAQGYQVYRKEGKDGTYKRVKTVTGLGTTSWQDKKAETGKTYYYKVRSYFKRKEGTIRSSFCSEKKADFAIPTTSWKSLKVKNYTTVQLSWKKANVTGYRIYRRKDSGKFVKIATIKSNATLSYKDTGVQPGHTYSYRIRCYKKVGGKNYYSKYTSVKKAEIAMKAPKLSSADKSGSKVKLTWKRDSKSTGYYVYRSNTKKGGYKKIKTISSNKTLEWTDSGISSAKNYYYKIRSYVKTSEGKKNSSYSRAMIAEKA